MVKLFSLANCFIATLVGQSTGHFLMKYPPTIGFDDDLEGNPPCGGFSVDFNTDNVTDFHVGGDVLAMTSIHPQATWLFRATLDITASGNWTDLLPAVQQTGLGAFCEPDVSIPASWAGSKGVIGVVQDAPDGILYQCLAVSFVTGTGSGHPDVCTNVTGTTASFVADASLSSLPASATTSSSSSTGAASTTSTTSSPSTATSSSANTVYSYSGFGMFAWFMIVGSTTFLACLM